MFKIDFYRTAQGFSDIEAFLDDLEKRAVTNYLCSPPSFS